MPLFGTRKGWSIAKNQADGLYCRAHSRLISEDRHKHGTLENPCKRFGSTIYYNVPEPPRTQEIQKQIPETPPPPPRPAKGPTQTADHIKREVETQLKKCSTQGS